MMIRVWHGCTVVAEMNLPDVPGPDIGLDPWADLIHTDQTFPVPYWKGFRGWK